MQKPDIGKLELSRDILIDFAPSKSHLYHGVTSDACRKTSYTSLQIWRLMSQCHFK